MARTEVRGGQILDSSVSLTVDVTGTLPAANGGTGNPTNTLNNVLLGNGTGALQTVAPGSTGNALLSNGTTFVAGANPGNPTTYLVAANNSSARDKAMAHYVCTGTGDEVSINAALTAVATSGGTVLLAAGTFNLAATIAITGGAAFADNPTVALIGAGADVTILTAATGITAITLTSTPKPWIIGMRINILGAADGIKCTAPTTGANDRRGFWMGRFEDLKIQGDSSTHTGWALNMEAPFRSTFSRIQAIGVKNGVWLKSSYVSFNPGNLVFQDCHMDLGVAGGKAYYLQSADAGGFFNICTFIECDCIDSTGSATASIGWHFAGSTTTYYTTRDILVLRANIEQFTTAVKFDHSANIEFNANYVETKTAGTVFSLSSDSINNFLSAQYIYVPSPKTTAAINDANTDPLKPNTLRNSFTRVETGGTLTLTKSVATILEKLSRDSDTAATLYPTEWQGFPKGVPRLTTLTDGVTITPNFTSTEVLTVTLAGNRTMAAPTGVAVDGQKIMFKIKQDATGTRTITWNAIYRFSGGTAPTLTTTASKTDYIGFQYNLADVKWDGIAERLGF